MQNTGINSAYLGLEVADAGADDIALCGRAGGCGGCLKLYSFGISRNAHFAEGAYDPWPLLAHTSAYSLVLFAEPCLSRVLTLTDM